MALGNVYLSFTGIALAPGSSKAPSPELTTIRGGYFKTHPGKNTPLQIAGDPSSHSPTVDHRDLAVRICNDPKNNPIKATRIRLAGKSVNFQIRNDVQVWVPPHQGCQIDVLCGDRRPQPTGGYGNWGGPKRPLARGLTIFQNYDPFSLQVEVRFGHWGEHGSWLTDDLTGQRVENTIAKLEWMAGHGIQTGPPPIVYVHSYDASGGDTDLIPKQYRGWPWIINGGIQWGDSYANRSGYRTRQDATLTLQNYLNLAN